MTKKADRRPLNGILLVNKPKSLTSNAVLQRIKHLFCAQKAGHMGSLDPLATGMLPICFGEATKFAQYGLEADKAYTVTALFGVSTTTGDAEGDVLERVHPVHLTVEDLGRCLPVFRGDITQVPPMYSALKQQGKKLYELARAGIVVERPARPVRIDQLELLSLNSPFATFQVRCTKGTYIRSLIEDMGTYLHLGAHVTELHRDYTAGFEDQPMVSLDELMSFTPIEQDACLLPMDYAVRYLPALILSKESLDALYQGQSVHWEGQEQEGTVRLYDVDQIFKGLGELDVQLLKPKRLLAHT